MFTQDDMKQAIDSYIGITSVIKEGKWKDEATLSYFSPIGTLLFEILITEIDNKWRFGGTSSAVPNSWKDLCQIGREDAKL